MSYTDKAKQIMLRKAQEKLDSARDDFKAQRNDSCISSLYYSSFQTITALLISRGESVTKHTHVRSYVNKELARKGMIDKNLAKLFNNLMDFCSDADYNTEIFFDEAKAEELLNGVEQLNFN